MERAYRCSAVSVITATSTLAAGVNLPARRVILRSLHQASLVLCVCLGMTREAGSDAWSCVCASLPVVTGPLLAAQVWCTATVPPAVT